MKAVHEYIPMVTQFVVAEEISFFYFILTQTLYQLKALI